MSTNRSAFDETVQSPTWNICSERRLTLRDVTSGFEAFVPLLRRLSNAPSAGIGAHAFSTAVAGPVPTSRCWAASVAPSVSNLSPVGLSIGRALGRFRLVRASIAAAPFPSNAFDLVTSFDVLYSLEERDEHAAVAEMFRMTRPGGYVLINVAAMHALRGDHSVLSREVRRYSRRELRNLVTGAGLTVERITYTNCTLFLPLVAVRTAQRWRGLASEGDATHEISVPPAPLNSLLTGLLLLESAWVRHLDTPFGSSLICLARKPAGPPVAAGT